MTWDHTTPQEVIKLLHLFFCLFLIWQVHMDSKKIEPQNEPQTNCAEPISQGGLSLVCLWAGLERCEFICANILIWDYLECQKASSVKTPEQNLLYITIFFGMGKTTSLILLISWSGPFTLTLHLINISVLVLYKR